MMLWKRDQLDAVRRLMRERRYQEAKALLRQIDHPKAQALMRKLDARLQRGRREHAEINGRLSMTHTLTAALLLILAIVGCGLLISLLNGSIRL